MSNWGSMERSIHWVVAGLIAAVGLLAAIAPVHFSQLFGWLSAPQKELMRKGSLFDTYFPDSVARSRSLRLQLRMLGAIFIVVAVMLGLSK